MVLKREENEKGRGRLFVGKERKRVNGVKGEEGGKESVIIRVE